MSYFLLAISSLITFTGTIKNRVIQNIGGIFLFITMVLVMGLNYFNADMIIYEGDYNNIDYFNNDLDITSISSWIYYFSTIRNFGFFYINAFFSSMGFSFATFRFLTSVFLLVLIFIQVKRLTPNYGMVMLLYFVYPFFWDTIQTKNFYAEVIMLLAIFLYSKSKKFSYLKYGITTLCAAAFHNVALAYLPFLLIEKLLRFRWFKIIVAGIVVTFPLISSIIKERAQSFILFFSSLSDSFNHYDMYSDWGTGILSFVHWAMMIFVWLVLFYIYKQVFQTKVCYTSMPKMTIRYLETVYKIWTYLLIFIPLFAVVVDAYRISRNMFLPFYICLANYKYYGIQKKRFIYIITLVTVTVYGILPLPKNSGEIFLNIPLPNLTTITEILDNNYLFDIFN